MTELLRSIARWLLPAVWCASATAQTPAACPPVAQAPSIQQVQAGERDARDRGFLWRISRGGHSSYLYGTVHVARLEWMFPGPAVTQALRASDTVALELDALDPDIQQRMARAMAAPAGAPLPAALQRRVAQQVRSACLPPEALAALSPEFQVAALATLLGRRDGLDAAYGIDTALSGWARAADKPVVSLETPELQLKAMQTGSRAETLEWVESALDEIESGRAMPALKRVAQVWADADLDALTRYESWCDCVKTAADRAAMKRLLDDRNPALAQAIGALHESGQRVFAAVGSLHMIGPLGLPALLERQGFRIERVAPGAAHR